jgi:hypothetical protein
VLSEWIIKKGYIITHKELKCYIFLALAGENVFHESLVIVFKAGIM